MSSPENKENPIGDIHWLELRRINDKLARMLKPERKIIEWYLAVGCNTSEIVDDVNYHLDRGWEIYGHLIIKGIGPYRYVQAIVKYEQI